MANKKISQLPVAQPASGSEILPVVQSGETRRITIQQLFANLGVPTPAPADTGLALINNGATTKWDTLDASKIEFTYNGIKVRASDFLTLFGGITEVIWNKLPEDDRSLGHFVIVSDEPPTDQSDGDVWWDIITNKLKRWDEGESSWTNLTDGGGGGGGSDVIFSPIPPGDPDDKDLWWDTSTNVLKYWNYGPNTWVAHETGSGGGGGEYTPIHVGSSSPVSPSNGDIWWNTYYETLLRYENPIWIELTPTSGGSLSVPSGEVLPYSGTYGDIFWKRPEGRIYYWDGSIWVPNEIGSGGGGGEGGSTIAINTTAPDTPSPGDFWWDATTNILKYWSGSAWIPHLTSASDQITISALPPAVPTNTMVWWDTTTETLKRWSGSSWIKTSDAVVGYGITSIVAISQGDYDNLISPDSETLYVIV